MCTQSYSSRNKKSREKKKSYFISVIKNVGKAIDSIPTKLPVGPFAEAGGEARADENELPQLKKRLQKCGTGVSKGCARLLLGEHEDAG